MGFWIKKPGKEPEWQDGDLNGEAYALTRQTKWYYTGLAQWLPSLGGRLNQELPVYTSATPQISKDIQELRTAANNASKGADHSLAPMLTSVLSLCESELVHLGHREERAEAFIQLVAGASFLYKINYKTNDPDRAWRLSYLVHELVHAECDQRYRYYGGPPPIIPALNANGDENDPNEDFRLIKARLDEIGKMIAHLDGVFDKVADTTLKAHLKARLGRANNTTQEWDTVMTELYVYLFLSTSADKPAKDAIRKCAEDAFKYRHTHAARGKTPRRGGIN
jgi:hypothetical protein